MKQIFETNNFLIDYMKKCNKHNKSHIYPYTYKLKTFDLLYNLINFYLHGSCSER